MAILDAFRVSVNDGLFVGEIALVNVSQDENDLLRQQVLLNIQSDYTDSKNNRR